MTIRSQESKYGRHKACTLGIYINSLMEKTNEKRQLQYTVTHILIGLTQAPVA